MRYPTSNDIIYIPTFTISFLSNKLKVFSRDVKHYLFSVLWSSWSFGMLLVACYGTLLVNVSQFSNDICALILYQGSTC